MILFLDLSKPNTLWHTMETLLEAARKKVEALMLQMKSTNPSVVARLRANAAMRFGNDHQVVHAMNIYR